MRRLSVGLVFSLLLAGCAGAPSDAPPAQPPDAAAKAFSSYLSARFAAREHDMPEAARYFGQSLRNDPDNPELLALAFFYSASSGDLETAGVYARQVVAKTPDDRATRLALAMIAMKHGDFADARKNLAASAKGPLTGLTVPLFDAWAAAGMGDAAAATSDLKDLSGQSGAQNVASFHAALIADFLKQKDADALYGKTMLDNAHSPRVADAYGRYLERRGRGEDARKFYETLQQTPGMAPVAGPGLARLAKGEAPDPLVRTAQDGAAEALFGIAVQLNDAADADISILYLRMALYLRPDFALAQILLADRFEMLHMYDDANAIYARIDKASPYYRMAGVQAALNQTATGHDDAAIAALKTLADANAGTDTWLALGNAYRDQGRYGEAISAYDAAEKSIGQPVKGDWTLYYARAVAEDKAGHWDKAEADVNTGLKLSPDQPELLNYLGYSWVDQGRRYADALAMLEKARALRPYDGYIVDSVGWAYYRMGRFQDAVQTLEAAVLLVPGDATVNDHLGDALWKVGRKMEARYQWNHALTFGPESDEKTSLEQKLKTGLSG